MKQGEAYWLSTPLPGTQGGGHHSSVIISSDAYNTRTNQPVIAGLRRGTPSSYRIEVTPTAFVPDIGQPALDGARVIGIDQLNAASSKSLITLHGTVDDSKIKAVKASLPRQFQMNATTYQHRGEIWTVLGGQGVMAQVVIVLNDRAVQNAQMTQVIALPYTTTILEAPLHMVAKASLDRHVGMLTPAEQSKLDAVLRDMFGI